jgi:hypothetical protein
MEVIALKQGYFGKLRAPDDKFDVPDGTKASWFRPVEPKAKADKPKPAGKQEAGDLV